MIDFYGILRKFLFLLDPEQAHSLALKSIGLYPNFLFSKSQDDIGLSIKLWGKTFSNPIGLAAGFDKNAQIINYSFNIGFGFIEFGGVTLRPQDGNPKPRLFRLVEDEAIINRMGFNNLGADKISASIKNTLSRGIPGPLAINIGLNKNSKDYLSDFTKVFNKFYSFVDLVVINVSSPNTPGLRNFQEPDKLKLIINTLKESIDHSVSSMPAILIKLSPDLNEHQLNIICDLAVAEHFDGLVVSNTTEERKNLKNTIYSSEKGGLSGRPLFKRSTSLIKTVYSRTGGKIPLIGVGGVSSGLDAYEKIRAGASLVQFYSALVFKGPAIVREIKKDLKQCLISDGFKNIEEAVGIDSK